MGWTLLLEVPAMSDLFLTYSLDNPAAHLAFLTRRFCVWEKGDWNLAVLLQMTSRLATCGA
jgi:hypothetical protein